MNSLTREQAIKRIKDIQQCKQVDHIYKLGMTNTALLSEFWGYAHYGAINELRAIFDIKEEELK